MLTLNEFSHNHHPPRVKMLAKYIRRGISGIVMLWTGRENAKPRLFSGPAVR